MDSIISFLTHNEKIVSLVEFLFFGIVSLLLFAKTGNIKYLKEVIEKMTSKENGNVFAGQTFSNLKPVYRLNKVTNELEKTDEVIDIQELINSCYDTCYEKLLEKFIPGEAPAEGLTFDVNAFQDDLDIMNEASMKAEEYRSKYGLSEELSATEVFSAVKDIRDKYLEKLKNSEKKEVPENGVSSKDEQKSE